MTHIDTSVKGRKKKERKIKKNQEKKVKVTCAKEESGGKFPPL